MKLSIFTTVTNPKARADNFKDALQCYADLADEIIVVNGGEELGTVFYDKDRFKVINRLWPQEFNWPFIGQQFQRGYEAATGDWVNPCGYRFPIP
jgi:glycosyltransferase involved in cell wall biosynthesis